MCLPRGKMRIGESKCSMLTHSVKRYALALAIQLISNRLSAVGDKSFELMHRAGGTVTSALRRREVIGADRLLKAAQAEAGFSRNRAANHFGERIDALV